MEKQDDPIFIMPVLETLMGRKADFTTRGYANALSTLAHLSRHSEDKSIVMSFIAGKLNDPKANIRTGAIRALATLKEPKAIAILEKWMSADPDSGERKAAVQAISDLKKMALPGEDLKGLRNKIQTMDSTQKSMSTTLEDLKKKLEALAESAVPEKSENENDPAQAQGKTEE